MFSSVCLVAETGFWCMIVCFLFIWPYNLCVSAIAFYSLRLCFTIAGFSDCVCGVDIALYRFNCTLCTHEKKNKNKTNHIASCQFRKKNRRTKRKAKTTANIVDEVIVFISWNFLHCTLKYDISWIYEHWLCVTKADPIIVVNQWS